MFKCPKCGAECEKEYVHMGTGYDFEVHTWCTKCDYEEYEG